MGYQFKTSLGYKERPCFKKANNNNNDNNNNNNNNNTFFLKKQAKHMLFNFSIRSERACAPGAIL